MTDITSILRNKYNRYDVLFNPSIAWIEDNDYLVTVRGWKYDRKIEPDTNPDLNKNRSHPWYYRWEGGSNRIYFYIIEIKINEEKGYYEIRKKQDFDVIIDDGEDARIFKVNRNEYYITYTVWIENDKDVIIKDGETCENKYCAIIEMSTLSLKKYDGGYELVIKKKDAGLCWNLSESTEKNWSLWNYENHNLLLYKLIPFEVFDFTSKDITEGCFKSASSNVQDFLHNLRMYYDEFICVSLSTPSYPFGDDGRYLTAGHIKCERNSYTKGNKNLAKFVDKYVNEKYIHYQGLIYFTFFIEFKPHYDKDENLNVHITRISNSFMIDGFQPYSIDFASGLTHNKIDNLWWLSYGTADAYAKIFPFNNRMINDLLREYDSLEPNEYEFGVIKFSENSNRCEFTF